MVVFVEGALASGKTTHAYRIKESLEKQQKQAVVYDEHVISNPLDLSVKVLLKLDEFKEFREDLYSEMLKLNAEDRVAVWKKRLEDSCLFLNGYVLIALDTLFYGRNELMEIVAQLYPKRIDAGWLEPQLFQQLLINRYRVFFSQFPEHEYLIFDGSLLMNPLLVLLGRYNFSFEEIKKIYMELSQYIKDRSFRVDLINTPETSGLLLEANKTRNSSIKGWLDGLGEWVEEGRFGRDRKLRGIDGAIAFNNELFQIEQRIVKECGFPYKLIDRG